MPAPPRNRAAPPAQQGDPPSVGDEEEPVDDHYDDELGGEHQQEGEEDIDYEEEEEEVLQEFDENGNPIDYDENGQQIIYDQQEQQYDEDGNPIDYDENGQQIVYEQQEQQYDENGNPIDYDENGQPIEYDENGQQIVYDHQEQQYDEDGNPIEYDENVQYVDEYGQPVQPEPPSPPHSDDGGGQEPYMTNQPPGTEYAGGAAAAAAAAGSGANKAKAEQPEQGRRGQKKSQTCACVLCIVIILILIIVGIVLGMTLSKNNSDKSVPVPAGPAPIAFPTGSPTIKVTWSPTEMPSFAPTFGPLPLAETQGWTDPNPLSGFGAAVTMAEKRLAIASPNGGTTSSGLVSIYDRVETARWLQAGIDFGTTWKFLKDIAGTSSQFKSEFGASIDFTPDAQSSGILIGAPGANLASGASPAGAAYFYRFDGGEWVPDGNAMQGGVANERFGASVGTSANFRAVIGAPDNNQNGTMTGKVYIYEFQSPDWVDKSPQDPPLTGQAENSRFGASVDISSTGDLIAIGEPGANSFTILERHNETGVWSVTLQLPHRPKGGDLGSSVKILSNNYIAVAAENAQQESGSVRIYAKDPLEGKWTEFGPIVYGQPGDRIGREGALDGGVGPEGPEIVVGTEQGFIKRFDLDAEQWFTRFEAEAGMPIVDAVGYTSGSVLAGSAGKVTYSEVEGFVPTVPTAPTAPAAPIAPAAPSATAPSAPTATTPSVPTAPTTEPPAAPAATAPSIPTAVTAAPSAPSTPTAASAAPVGSDPLTVKPTALPLSTVQSPSPTPDPMAATLQPVATTPAPVSVPTAATLSPTAPAPVSVPTAATLSPTATAPVAVPTAATLPPSTTAPSTTGTLSPTLTKGWVLTDGPITVSAVSSGFGSAVALGNNLFAAGVPSLTIGTSRGAVQSFEPDVNGEWISESAIVFESGTAQFGAALDIESTSLIVGDPDSKDPVFLQPFGAAYVYVQQGNSWSALGGVMRPDATPPETQGRFGAAVATASSVQRVAVGAPVSNIVDTDNSIRLRAGRIYTWGYNGTGWDKVGDQLWGAAQDDRLGTSIDMTGDGNGLLVGAPGPGSSPGSVAYYKWSGAGWTPTFTVPGTGTESLGNKVAILSQDGSLLAASGQGVVRVYSQTGAQIGKDIVGVTTSLTGANGRLIVGLSSGFRAYDFDAAVGDWVEVETGPSTSSPVISISTSADATTVVAGLQSEEIFVYNLV